MPKKAAVKKTGARKAGTRKAGARKAAAIRTGTRQKTARKTRTRPKRKESSARSSRSAGRRATISISGRTRLQDFVSDVNWNTSGYDEPVRTAELSEAECYGVFQSVIEEVGEFDSQSGHINILGIRGFLDGEITENIPNEYNDTITVVWQDQEGKHCRQYKASVDPGKSYTEDPFHPEKGCAHLMDGQYLYKLGLHKGEYEALRQAGDVRVWRDYDKDFEYDNEEIVEQGGFGINIHAGGRGSVIDKYSAGCQIIHGGRDGTAWNEFMNLARSHPESVIRYTLVDRQALGYPPSKGLPDFQHG